MRADKFKENGRYADGGGLYLQIRGASRVWIFRYASRTDGREHDMGLGPLHTISLQRARELAQRHRAALLAGNDPLASRRLTRDGEKLAKARALTFGMAATQYIETHRHAWRSKKHTAQWRSTLETFCAPIWSLSVADVDTALVLKCLQPHWTEKTETMVRVRGRIECVLDWAAVDNHRTTENPARWKGHLDKRLPKRSKVQPVEHRVALPHTEMHAFMAELRAREGLAARSLELQILCGSRPGEATNAEWSEFDLERATWTIPAARMKASKDHRVPLSVPLLKMLRALPRKGVYLFPSPRGKKPITTAAQMALLDTLRPEIDAHGFRSSFSDWAGDTTNHPRDVVEMALAHTIKNAVEAAYRRGDAFEKRTRLMADWARYCDTPPKSATVTPIRKRKRA